MKRLIFLILFIFIIGCTIEEGGIEKMDVKLPKPNYKSDISIEQAIYNRESVRSYSDKPVTLKQISQLLWSAQGKSKSGKRTAPSAGALYPMEIYLIAGNIVDLEKGVYHYKPEEHTITKKSNDDLRKEIASAAYGQSFIAQAPIVIVITGVYERTTVKYGERGIRYVHIEAGHIGENIYLQCQSLGLGTVVVGAFDDNDINKLLDIEETPFYIMPVGGK